MNKNTVPEGFTIKLALIDAIPVVFFALSMILVGRLLNSPLFIAGALLVLAAGAAKVLWKFIVVLKKKNVWFLFIQMRIIMPVGLILMIAGIFVNRSAVTFGSVTDAILTMPSLIFFALGALGMTLMAVFAFTLDGKKVKSNWIEQITNGIAQICIFLGILFIGK